MVKIAIRADGGSEIGIGHIMRTLVLAKELAKTNDVFYVCKNSLYEPEKYRSGIDKIRSEGFDIQLINENLVVDELKKIKADYLITDSYSIDEQYFNETKKIFKKTIYIDDMNLFYFNVDIIINQNIMSESMTYKTNKNTKLLLGAQYLLIRDEFRNAKRKYIKDSVNDILITVGGSDNNFITNKLLDFIKDLNFNYHVVIGPSFKNTDLLKMLEDNSKNIKLYYNANILELINKCDIAISACGSTLYELAICGMPTLGVIIADNQKILAENLSRLGAIINLGDIKTLKRDEIIRTISEIENYKTRIMLNANSNGIVDGKGVHRIVKAIE